jgi:hypothetical protein
MQICTQLYFIRQACPRLPKPVFSLFLSTLAKPACKERERERDVKGLFTRESDFALGKPIFVNIKIIIFSKRD